MESPAITPQTRLDPQDIACVAQTGRTDHVNEYLALGWIVLGTASSQYSEHGFSLTYHLAWSKHSGEPKHPELGGWGVRKPRAGDEAESDAPF